MKPRAQQNLFVGFDDTSKSVKYYKANTQKILISQNFCFLTLKDEEPSNNDPIAVEADLPPHILYEGELENSVQRIKQKNKNDPCDVQSDNEMQGQGDKRNLQKKLQVNYKIPTQWHKVSR